MYRAGCFPRIGDVLEPDAQLADAVQAGVVHAGQAGDSRADGFIQGFKRGVHVGEAGVPPGWWDLQRIKGARHRRDRIVAHVGVPFRLIVAKTADGFAVLHHVGNDIDIVAAVLGLAVFGLRVARVAVQRPEIAAERQQLVVGQGLAAEPQHQVAHPGLVDRAEIVGR